MDKDEILHTIAIDIETLLRRDGNTDIRIVWDIFVQRFVVWNDNEFFAKTLISKSTGGLGRWASSKPWINSYITLDITDFYSKRKLY